MVVAVVAPGQGAQKPGFLTPWLELPGARAKLAWWSQLAGVDLVRLGTEADAEEIKDTAKTQPLLVAAGLLAATELPMDDVAVVAGHSIGELVAAQLSGVLSSEAAVGLAARRGAEMAAACAHAPTGMSAVLGGDPDAVNQQLEALGLKAANHNSAGQVVAAGPLDALAKLAENPPPRARIIPLSVAGAFHTEAMRPAQEALEQIAEGITVGEPHKIMISNADGTAVHSGADTLARLVAQVTRSVRWDLCQSCLKDLGVTAIIELPPAGVLTGLAKRELKGIELLAVNTPEDLAAARELIVRHGESHEPFIQSVGSIGQIAVAPTAGTFEPAELIEGEAVGRHTPIGTILTRQGETPVIAPGAGVLAEWLADSNDPVAAGQPLARIQAADDHHGSLADASTAGTAA